MSENPHVELDKVRALAEALRLEVPSTDLPALQRSLAEYVGRVSLLRLIDPVDCEPPVITYEQVYGDESGK